LLDADRVAVYESAEIVEDAAEHVTRQRAARKLPSAAAERLIRLPRLGPRVVETLQHERHPSDLALGQHHAELRELLEATRVQPAGERELRVDEQEVDGQLQR